MYIKEPDNALGPKVFLNFLQRLALGLVAEDGDVGKSSQVDGGEQPEHASLGDAIHQWVEGEGHQEEQRTIEARGQ